MILQCLRLYLYLHPTGKIRYSLSRLLLSLVVSDSDSATLHLSITNDEDIVHMVDLSVSHLFTERVIGVVELDSES